MAAQAVATLLPLAGSHMKRPGVVIRGFPPDSADQESLEFALYTAMKNEKIPKIITCQFTEDKLVAYMELEDPYCKYIQCDYKRIIFFEYHYISYAF